MSVATRSRAPERPPQPNELEALLEEPRRRARRRRLAYVAALVLAVGGALYGIFGGGGGGGHRNLRPQGRAPGQPPTRGQERREIERAAATATIVESGVVDSRIGWAMNGFGLWLTLDGGSTWRTITPRDVRSAGDAVARITQIEFVDKRHVWIGASDIRGRVVRADGSLRHMTIDRTSDGGKTWSSVIPPGCAACGGAHVSFLDTRHGFALTGLHPQPHLYETADGGVTWQRIAEPHFSGAIVFVNRREAFGVSDPARMIGPSQSVPVGGGILYRTVDGGHRWHRVQLPKPPQYVTFPETIDLPRFFGARNGVLPVRFRDPKTHAQRVVVYVSGDGGQTWSARPAPATADVRSYSWSFPGALPFSAATRSDWVLFVAPTLYVTRDAGSNWSVVHARYAPKPPGIWDVNFTSPTAGWAIFSARTGAALVHTSNGGRDWTPLSPPVPKAPAHSP